MSIFTKPLSQLITADLQELLDDGAIENVRLEFKSEAPKKDEALKKLSAFANTFGGYMVVGAKARSSDGRIEELPGVDVQSGYKQTLVQWGFDGASPPLTVEVSDPIPTPAGGGKVCYVVYTSESDTAPHFLNGRKGVWVRTDEFSARFEARLANENELRHLLDRRRLIRERRAALIGRAQKRFGIYAERRIGELIAQAGSPQARQIGATLTVCVVPRFPSRPLVEQFKLREIIERNKVPFQGLYFPKTHNPIISQHESTIVLHAEEELSILEANVWGLLFYGTQIEDDTQAKGGIHLYHLVGCVLLFLRHAAGMLRVLGCVGPLLVEAQLKSVLGLPWLFAPSGFVQSKKGSELDDDVSLSIETTSEALQENSDRIAGDLLQQIGFSLNWPEIADTPERLQVLVKSGYRYNAWRYA